MKTWFVRLSVQGWPTCLPVQTLAHELSKDLCYLEPAIDLFADGARVTLTVKGNDEFEARSYAAKRVRRTVAAGTWPRVEVHVHTVEPATQQSPILDRLRPDQAERLELLRATKAG